MRCNELLTTVAPNGNVQCMNCGTEYSRELYPERCVALIVDGVVTCTL